MNKSFVLKIAVAALLAFGSISQAQEISTPPAPDAIEGAAQNQASASDNVVIEGEVAPVEPIQESVIYDSNLATGSSCVGCGQASPFASAQVERGCSGCGQAATYSAISVASHCGGCSGSGGCSPCGGVQMAAFSQECLGGCSQGCGQINQVTFDQPIYQTPTISSVPATMASSPMSILSGGMINPAPIGTIQRSSSDCSSCVAPAVTCTANCNNCPPQRFRLFRGRLRNR